MNAILQLEGGYGRGLAGSALALAGLLAAAPVPVQAGTPTIFLENSTIAGATNTVTLTRVPVQTAAGGIVYWDVVIQLTPDSAGKLSISRGYPKITPAVALLTSNFKAGNYVGPSQVAGGKFLTTIAGPGAAPAGLTVWTMKQAAGADLCTTPVSATWYTGPLSANPQYPRLVKAGITSTAYSYGTIGVGTPNSNCGADNSLYWHFKAGSLIGVAQAGNTVTIVSFTNNTFDQSAPVDQITYTLAP